MKIGTMVTPLGDAEIHVERYAVKKSISVQLIGFDEGYPEPYGTLSVNLPEQNALLGKGEFFAKTSMENDILVEPALASGYFADTGRRVPTGFVEASIWRLNVPDDVINALQ